ncbi:hypothetical protein JR316_0006579 [Psilocybe cubensis]|uniref:Uncharacterized protein n=1 Tax=Psilocybe cubensis TaxID=181762 RepID=A0ACB8GX87_PSICU|nr:hypothetical protein JR316_0006579 [Psilocybe cubensis]KAH9479982.1 hypothetical protein JR316_0006579 [Psilocybe cubensis]
MKEHNVELDMDAKHSDDLSTAHNDDSSALCLSHNPATTLTRLHPLSAFCGYLSPVTLSTPLDPNLPPHSTQPLYPRSRAHPATHSLPFTFPLIYAAKHLTFFLNIATRRTVCGLPQAAMV